MSKLSWKRSTSRASRLTLKQRRIFEMRAARIRAARRGGHGRKGLGRERGREVDPEPELGVLHRDDAPVHDDLHVLLVDVAREEVHDDVEHEDGRHDAVRDVEERPARDLADERQADRVDDQRVDRAHEHQRVPQHPRRVVGVERHRPVLQPRRVVLHLLFRVFPALRKRVGPRAEAVPAGRQRPGPRNVAALQLHRAPPVLVGAAQHRRVAGERVVLARLHVRAPHKVEGEPAPDRAHVGQRRCARLRAPRLRVRVVP
eukprot:340577-Rhodomonas_salina.1